jgi:hypothetical protein
MARPRKDQKLNIDYRNFTPDSCQVELDSLISNLVDEYKKEFSGDVYSGNADSGLLICLPVPALSVRYLLQQEGWPLSRFVMLVGEQESCKSSFLYEIIRWHRQQMGCGFVFDTELKPAPDLINSILNYDKGAIHYIRCYTLEDWCNKLTNLMTTTKKKMDDPESKFGGRVIPICFGVDTITAVVDEKEYKRMTNDGTPEKRYASSALLLTDYMKFITKELVDYPFSFVGVNHLKSGVSFNGTPIRSISGGRCLRFHEAMEIELRRLSSVNPTSKNQIYRHEGNQIVEGVEIQLSVMKNSNAPHETIRTEMLWYIDYSKKIEKSRINCKTGQNETIYEYPQVTWFDWHSSSVDIIYEIQNCGTKQAKMLQDVIQIYQNERTSLCWSPVLGISEQDRLPKRELGFILEQKIQQDETFRADLYSVLGIRRRYLYKAGIDYLKMIDEINKVALDKSFVNIDFSAVSGNKDERAD